MTLPEWEKVISSPYWKELMVGNPPSPSPLHFPSKYEMGAIAGCSGGGDGVVLVGSAPPSISLPLPPSSLSLSLSLSLSNLY